MIDGKEKPKIPSKFAKRAARYNEFGCKVFFFAYSQKIDTPESFVVLFFIRKDSTVV